jgi:hypothetical protein
VESRRFLRFIRILAELHLIRSRGEIDAGCLWNSQGEVGPGMAGYDTPFDARQEQSAGEYSKRENGARRARRRNSAWARIGNISLGVWILTIPFV